MCTYVVLVRMRLRSRAGNPRTAANKPALRAIYSELVLQIRQDCSSAGQLYRRYQLKAKSLFGAL
jgi:hypothetical protein